MRWSVTHLSSSTRLCRRCVFFRVVMKKKFIYRFFRMRAILCHVIEFIAVETFAFLHFLLHSEDEMWEARCKRSFKLTDRERSDARTSRFDQWDVFASTRCRDISRDRCDDVSYSFWLSSLWWDVLSIEISTICMWFRFHISQSLIDMHTQTCKFIQIDDFIDFDS